MRVGSVCSGIGGAELAFDGHEHVFAAETEAFPRAVLRHHYPDLYVHGDFTTIEGEPGAIDVLVGGTPCQSFSVAGLRGGLADERGNLALEYLRLAQRLQPTWILWENVPGVLSSNGGRDFGTFVGGLAELGYGWAWRVLDAQYFGLAQRRQRVFVVGCLGDWRRAAAVLFEPSCLRGHPPPRREAGQRTTSPLAAGSPDGSGYRNDADTADNLIAIDARQSDVIQYGDIAGPVDTDGHSVAMCLNAHGGSGRIDAESETFVTHSLRADGFDASEDGTGRGTPLVAQRSSVRRLLPIEAERLQGFPDGWTDVPYRGKPAADGPRYRALGNAFAVPVVRWIARRIAREHGNA